MSKELDKELLNFAIELKDTIFERLNTVARRQSQREASRRPIVLSPAPVIAGALIGLAGIGVAAVALQLVTLRRIATMLDEMGRVEADEQQIRDAIAGLPAKFSEYVNTLRQTQDARAHAVADKLEQDGAALAQVVPSGGTSGAPTTGGGSTDTGGTGGGTDTGGTVQPPTPTP